MNKKITKRVLWSIPIVIILYGFYFFFMGGIFKYTPKEGEIRVDTKLISGTDVYKMLDGYFDVKVENIPNRYVGGMPLSNPKYSEKTLYLLARVTFAQSRRHIISMEIEFDVKEKNGYSNKFFKTIKGDSEYILIRIASKSSFDNNFNRVVKYEIKNVYAK